MPTLQDLRQQIPYLDGLDDEHAINFVQQTYFPQKSPAEVGAALGYKAPVIEPQASFADRVKDTGVGLMQGGVNAAQSIVGLADIPTGGEVGKFLDDHGIDLAGAQQYWNDKLSPAQQAVNAKVGAAFEPQADDQYGLASQLGRGTVAAIKNPSSIWQSVLQSLPSQVLGGYVGKGVLWATLSDAEKASVMALPAAQRAGAIQALAPKTAGVAGGIGEGVVTAGNQEEQIRTDPHNPSGLTDMTQGGLAGGSGAMTGAIAALTGALAKRFGLETTQNLLAGVRADPKQGLNAMVGVLGAGMSEGTQEFLQSAQEQMAQNQAVGDPIWQGVPQQAVIGALTGAAQGATAHGVFHNPHAGSDHLADPTDAIDPGTPAVLKAAASQAMNDIGAAPDVDSAIDAFNRTQIPVVPVGSGLDAAGAMQRLADHAEPSPPGATIDPETGELVPPPTFVNRLTDLKTQLGDSRVRQQIRETSGPQALNDILYYSQAADNPALPGKTSDRMLSLAEALLFRAQTTRMGPGIGMDQQAALTAPPTTPLIGLDTNPTGRMLASAEGTVTPEIGADVVSRNDAARAAQPIAVDAGGVATAPDTTVPPDQATTQVPQSATTNEGVATLPVAPVTPVAPAPVAPLPQPVAPIEGAAVQKGAFNSAADADAYISQQRRGASFNLPTAVPIQHADGSWGIVTEGKPGFEQALAALPPTPGLKERAQALMDKRDGIQPGDIKTKGGKAFATLASATSRAAALGAGHEPVEVRGGWVVRPPISSLPSHSAPVEAAAVVQPAPSGGSSLVQGQTYSGKTIAGNPITGAYTGTTSDGRIKLKQGTNVHYVGRDTIEGLSNATQQGNQQEVVRPEHQDGNQGRQAPEASGGDRVQPDGASQGQGGSEQAPQEIARFGPRGLAGNSWVIREKATGKVVMETRDRAKVQALNTEKYGAVPVGQHLAELNNPETLAAKAARGAPLAERAKAMKNRQQQAGETATRRAHNPETPGSTPGLATNTTAAAVPEATPAEQGIGDKPAAGDREAPPDTIYKTRARAVAARKELGNGFALQKVKTGYKLRARTDAEMASSAAAGDRLKRSSTNPQGDSLLVAIAKAGGLAMSERRDTIHEGNKNAGGKMVFTKEGRGIDAMAERMAEEGYIPPDEVESDGGVSWLQNAIAEEFGGEKHFSQNGEEWMRQRRDAAMGDAPDYKELGLDDKALTSVGYFDADEQEQRAFDDAMSELQDDHADADAVANFMQSVQDAADEEQAPGAGQAESVAAGQEAQGGADASGGRPSLELTAPTQEGLTEAAARRTAAEQADAAEQQRLADKAKADAEVGKFGLTGSDRPADAAGARDLFAEDERKVYSVNEPGKNYDLFDDAPVSAEQKKAMPNATPVLAVRPDQAMPGLYNVSSQLVEVGRKELPVERINSWADLAAATRALSTFAVEHFDAVVTDKNGTPLAIIGSFKGAQTQTSVYPSTVLAEALRIDGAAKVWASHNHPSGNSTLSRADEHLSGSLKDTFAASRIQYMGLAAVSARAGGEYTAVGHDLARFAGPIPNGAAKFSVPVVERTVLLGDETRDALDSPGKVKSLLQKMDQGKSGILFMGNDMRPTAFVPIERAQALALAGNGRFDQLINSASEAGATGAILSDPNMQIGAMGAENIGAALSRADVRLLDHIDPVSNTSMAERGSFENGAGLTVMSAAEAVARPASKLSDYANAPPAHHEASGSLRDAMNIGVDGRPVFGRTVQFDPVKEGPGTPPEQVQMMAAIRSVAKRAFGHETIFVRYRDGVRPLFNAVVSANVPGKVFVNADTKKPMLALLGHELLHQLRITQPELYRDLQARLNEVIQNEDLYRDELGQKYAAQGANMPANWLEELHGDIVGDRFMESEFWKAMAEKQPGLFARLAQAIMKFLDNVKTKLGGKSTFGTEKYLSDIDEARAAVVEAMSAFNKAATKSGTEGINLSMASNKAQVDSLAFRAWSKGAPMVTSAQAEQHDFKTGQKVVVEAFHGTGRPDRVGSKFNPKRATSGPMQYFTSDPAIASNYATGKPDTSLALEEQGFDKWFKVRLQGDRSDTTLDRAWYRLPAETQQRIAERLPDIRLNDDGDVVYEKGGGDLGNYDWELKQTQRGYDKRGNPLKAAMESWLQSGSIFDHEEDFMQVLKLAGFPMDRVTFDSPHSSFPSVYKTYVAMRNPLVVGDIPQSVHDGLAEAAKRDRGRVQQGLVDAWDKNGITLRQWVEKLSGDSGTYAWTQIPDRVSNFFRSQGYDGIVDTGGKGGGPRHVVYIPFDPRQIKSAIGNRGTFDETKPDITASAAEPQSQPFYSALNEAVGNMQMKSGNAGAWSQFFKGLQGKGVKADEIAWSGVEDWIKAQDGKVTREQVQQYLADNGVQVQETTLADPAADLKRLNAKLPKGYRAEMDMDGQHVSFEMPNGESDYYEGLPPHVQAIVDAHTGADGFGLAKYGKYTLPGGENYREVLLTLPREPQMVHRVSAAGGAVSELPDVVDFNTRAEADAELARRQAAQPRLHHSVMSFEKLARDGGAFRSNHWDQPNILAHTRLNDRTDADGKKVLFVEEIQSDWAQQGKKSGFGEPADPARLRTAEAKAREVLAANDNLGFDSTTEALAAIRDHADWSDRWEVDTPEQRAALGLYRQLRAASSSGGPVPSAPFVGKTEAWTALAIKRIAKMAVDEGYDRVAFVNGEQSAQRYDLSKQVDSIVAVKLADGDYAIRAYKKGSSEAIPGLRNKRVSEADLPDLVGKDLAEKIIKGEGGSPMPNGGRDYRGLDLKVGGEGMKAFYDKIVPNVAKDVVKKLGGDGLTKIDFGTGNRGDNAVHGISDEQPGFDITPKMRAQAANGVPLFSIADAPKTADNMATGIRGFNQAAARNLFLDFIKNDNKIGLWAKSIGTQYAKAEANPTTFKPVFEAVQNYIKDTNLFANTSQDMAPDILPKLNGISDLKRRATPKADIDAAGKALWQGTLTDSKVYDRAELTKLGLTDKQADLYYQARAAIDQSIDDMVKSELVRLAGKPGEAVSSQVMAARSAGEGSELLKAYLAQQGDTSMHEMLDDKIAQTEKLKSEGYAPLMRFGEHTVHVTNVEGDTLYFSMHESNREANAMARQLKADPQFKGDTVTRGLMSQEAYKLYSGMPIDALELFAKTTGNEDNPVYQDFLKLTKNNRSVLKRLIHREGIAGFEQNMQRVLAQFLTSNARYASGNLNLGVARNAVEAIPKEFGDIKDEAAKLLQYVQNPKPEAVAFRGLLFASAIGGSVASAAVNLTQPFMMTLPYLSQFGGAVKAAGHLMAASKQAAGGKVESELAKAMHLAEERGIVSPQEIHTLQAEAMGNAQHPLVKKGLFLWGSMFSLSEQFNRRVTFIAAYNQALQQHIADPQAFAEKAVIETQGLYNKGNKPNWARGPIGASLMTFKQFSIHYLEFLGRLATAGEPGSPERAAGRKAFAVGIATLMLTAGAGGLPFADDLDDIIDTIAQSLGYDFSSKAAKRDFIANTLGLGDTMAKVVTTGISGLGGFPISINARMGLGDLIPGTGILLRSDTDRSKDVLQIAGAAGSMAQNMLTAGGQLLQGDVGAAATSMMPTALKNMVKATEMWNTGEYRSAAGKKVMDVDAMDAIAKGIGFQPAQVAQQQELISEQTTRINLAKNVTTQIAAKWAQALNDGDTQGADAARQELRDWNDRNPQDGLKISMQSVLGRVRQMRLDAATRSVRSTPLGMRQDVRDALTQ